MLLSFTINLILMLPNKNKVLTLKAMIRFCLKFKRV